MGKEKYISLIAKQLSNELNSAELRELNLWLSGNSNNIEIVSDFKNVWSSVSSYKASTSFDTNAAFSKFSEKYDLTESNIIDTKSVPKPANNSLMRIALLLFAAIALFLGGYFLSEKTSPSFENKTMAVLPITLSKNISATLKPNSSLKYNEKSNIVSNFNGGGYFEVNKGKGSSTDNLTFELKDSELILNSAIVSIDNYNGEDIIAQVKEGKLTYNHNNGSKELIKGQKLIISSKNGSHSVIESEDKSALNIEKDILSFNRTPLAEVFESIEKFYGVEIIIKDDSVLKGHFTAANLKPSSLNTCLQLLKSAISMDISRTNNQVYISNIKAK